jgi:hypothetical protein
VVVVVALGVDATVATDDVVEALRASAGSCPETSTIAIISHAATNSATEAEITRRRIVRARAVRASRSACPRARAAAASLSVMGSGTSRSNEGELKRVISFASPRISDVRQD